MPEQSAAARAGGKAATLLSDDIARIAASCSLSDVYAQLDGRELLVEPLSAKLPLGRFLAEGGLGYGALAEGSFAATVCRVKGPRLDYGSDFQTLYNVGYPLLRLMEGGPHAALGGASPSPQDLRELTVYVRPRRRRVAVFRPVDAVGVEAPEVDADAFYVNANAAKFLGLGRAGMVVVYPPSEAPDEPALPGFWEKRFIEDALPAGQAVFKALIQPSRLPLCVERGESSGLAVFALFVQLGMLLLMAGDHAPLQEAEREILSAPLTWKLPGPRR